MFASSVSPADLTSLGCLLLLFYHPIMHSVLTLRWTILPQALSVFTIYDAFYFSSAPSPRALLSSSQLCINPYHLRCFWLLIGAISTTSTLTSSFLPFIRLHKSPLSSHHSPSYTHSALHAQFSLPLQPPPPTPLSHASHAVITVFCMSFLDTQPCRV